MLYQASTRGGGEEMTTRKERLNWSIGLMICFMLGAIYDNQIGWDDTWAWVEDVSGFDVPWYDRPASSFWSNFF